MPDRVLSCNAGFARDLGKECPALPPAEELDAGRAGIRGKDRSDIPRWNRARETQSELVGDWSNCERAFSVRSEARQ